jgi:hypothetical protein
MVSRGGVKKTGSQIWSDALYISCPQLQMKNNLPVK